MRYGRVQPVEVHMLIGKIRRALESAGLLHREAKRAPGQFLDRTYSNGVGNLNYL